MAHIQMIRAGYSSAEARQSTAVASGLEKYEDALVITPDGVFDTKRDQDAREHLFDFEKSKLLELKAEGWDTSIRKEREGFGAAREYDHMVVGFTAEETRYYRGNPDAQEKLQEALVAMTKTESGQKSAVISRPHFDTANGHVHITLHRFPVNVDDHKIGVADDLSKRSNASAFMDRFNGELEARGLQKMQDFRLMDGSGLMQDVSKSEAKETVADMIRAEGGVASRVEHTLDSVAVERESLIKLETSGRVDAERIEIEIQKLRDSQNQAVERVTLAQQAQAALAERDSLKGTIEQQAGQIGELQTGIAERDTQIGNLEGQIAEQGQQLDEVGQRALAQSIKLEELGEKVENLTGELEEVAGELDEERGKAKALGEELGSARDTIAHQEQEIASLNTDRERLTGELADTRALVAEQRAMLEDMRGMMAEQRQQIEAQRAQITEQQGLIAQTTQQIEGLRAEGARLEEQATTRGHEIEGLRAEGAKLGGELSAIAEALQHREATIEAQARAMDAQREIAAGLLDGVIAEYGNRVEYATTAEERAQAQAALEAFTGIRETVMDKEVEPAVLADRLELAKEAAAFQGAEKDQLREAVKAEEARVSKDPDFQRPTAEEFQQGKVGTIEDVEIFKSKDGAAIVAMDKEGNVVDYSGDAKTAQSLAGAIKAQRERAAHDLAESGKQGPDNDKGKSKDGEQDRKPPAPDNDKGKSKGS